MIAIALIAIYGLAFLIKESDGPFGIINWLRNRLIANRFVGVFFYKLLDCWFCTGCHCGWIVYLLYSDHYTWQFFILWILAGGTVSLFIDALFSKLHQ